MPLKSPSPPHDSRAARLLRQAQRRHDLSKKNLGRMLCVAPDTAQSIADGFIEPRIGTMYLARVHFKIPFEAWITQAHKRSAA